VLTHFVTGLGLGAAQAPICLGTCAPAALSAVVDAPPGRPGPAWRSLGLFLAGRAGAYAVLGGLAGALAERLTLSELSAPLAAAFVALAAALWLGALGRSAPAGSWACRFAQGPGRFARRPVLLGALTGLQLCPPLLLAFGVALRGGGLVAALAQFAGFFLGTSAGLAPLAAWPWAGRLVPAGALARMRPALALLVGFFFFCWGLDRLFPPKTVALPVTESDLREVFPGAAAFAAAANPPRFDAFRAAGETRPIGACFVTSQVAPAHTDGYGGPVSALVGLDASGAITGVKLLPHRETPVYVARIEDPAYLARYRGRKVTEPLVLGRDVDAVTAATVTAEALAAGIREAGRWVAASAFGLDVADRGGGAPAADAWRAAVSRWDVWLLAGYLAAAALAVRLRPTPATRAAVLAASIAVLGLVLMQFVSIGHVVQIVSGRWPPLPSALIVYVLLGGVLLITLCWGRLYCACLCPFGALTDFLGRLPFARIPLSERLSRRLRPARFALLLATPAAFFVWRSQSVVAYEPFSPTFSALSGRGLPADAAILALLGLIALLSLAHRRFWCRHLCPAGAALEVVAELRGRPVIPDPLEVEVATGDAAFPGAAPPRPRETVSHE
jgi:sulfite exporter TauE/SafE